ncbi:hypothetical protein CRG98_005951 [Punica granatum]|nr:hypothetical protein CRG98_005951 [Punica granatum]
MMRYSNSSSSSSNPFTANQWQELEHQALIYKYLVSGIPVPPDLLFPLKRSSSLHHMGGWSCYHHQYQHPQTMLGSRKIDPEPGRCRRTDGKKWRCSKEAFPDSKYCERHMHRGKNRSRKHVEQQQQLISSTASTTATTMANQLTGRSSSLYSLDSNAALSRPHHHSSVLSDHNYFLDSGSSYSQLNSDYRYAAYGMKEEVDEHAFFSEPSGTMRNFSTASSMEDSWQHTPLTMSFSSSSSARSRQSADYPYLQLQSLGDYPKQESKPSNHHYLYTLGTVDNVPVKHEREQEDEPHKTIHRFFDEEPIRGGSRDSWIDPDEKSSNSSTTRLSISMPSSSSNDRFP